MKTKLTVALAGNPNAGKTTIFNNLTGSRQHVGNYPGVTVEKKEGRLEYKDYDITIIDLPGTYSLTSFSPEEVIARNVLLEEDIDVVVHVVDATNAERHMNLTAQLIELGLPLVVALNVMDMAQERGISFDIPLLSQLLGAPVVPVVGTKNEGITALFEAVITTAEGRTGLYSKVVKYAPEVEEEITLIQAMLPEELGVAKGGRKQTGSEALKRWFAIKLLERDKNVLLHLKTLADHDKILNQVDKSGRHLQQHGHDYEMAIVNGRYSYIRGAIRETQRISAVNKVDLTEMIDRVLLNRVLGLPIFLCLIWLLFQITFTVGASPMDWIGKGFGILAGWIDQLLPDGLFRSLVVDGIIGGVGGVIVFLPNILLLFLGIAILEGTGYMARAAFVMDKLMHKVGLHGKSFIPMVLGFGCSVPAIMATRTLENERDRLVTMLVIPLMSCSARLPVYTLLTAAFFDPQAAGTVMFSIYLVGILLAVIVAKILRACVLPGESEPFVMELPAYRLPTFKSVLIQMWERTWLYLKKAGTIILAASVIMWTLFTFPQADQQGRPFINHTVQMEQSYAGRVGQAIEPLVRPLGFDWKTGVALVAGFAAKEVVVSTMGTLYSIEDSDALAENTPGAAGGFAERAREQSAFTPLIAYVLMLFVLIYVPCLATVAVLHRETNGWKWPLFMTGYTLTLAWVVSFVVYRVGLLLGIGL